MSLGCSNFFRPTTPFNDSLEFENGVELESASELDMNITTDVEHHDFDES